MGKRKYKYQTLFRISTRQQKNKHIEQKDSEDNENNHGQLYTQSPSKRTKHPHRRKKIRSNPNYINKN